MIEVKSPFGRLLGMRITRWSTSEVCLELPLKADVRTLSGTLHGGVIAALVDFAGSMAGSLGPVPGESLQKVVSLSISVNFLGRVRGDTVFVRGRKTGGGRRIFMSSVEITDQDGALVATGQGAFKLTDKRGSASGG
jgi:uncharacterized protein (TIGR00369 family)